MKTMISIDVALETDGVFEATGRERRAAAVRTLQRMFAGPDWGRDDDALEGVFGAVEIEHRFRDPEERSEVTVRERPAPVLRLVRGGAEPDDPDGREQAREILLYLEAVAMSFADRSLRDRDGLPGAGAWYEGALPWGASARRILCERAAGACADLAALLDGRAPSAAEGRLGALGVLETAADALGRLDRDLGGARWSFDGGRFRETAGWSGRPRRVRGVYRPSIWESAIRGHAAALGGDDADFMYECVRDHRSVWPWSLEFTADFFPLALRLFRVVASDHLPGAETGTTDEAGIIRPPYPVRAARGI